MTGANDILRLTALARRNGWISTGDEIRELESAGQGNMNRVQRARLASAGTLIFKESLPYVAKYPDIPAPLERIEVEAAFYRAIEGTAVTRHTPAIIGFDPDNHLLCLEDLGAGADMTGLYADGYSSQTDTLSRLLEWLGDLHGTPVEAPARFANPAMRALNHTHIFVLPFEPDNGLEFSAELTDGWKAIRDDRLVARAHDLGESYLRVRTGNAVLLHGDFYPGSWLVTERAGFAVIDPEFGFFGPAEFDVGVFWAHLAFARCSSTDMPALLDAYQAPAGFDMGLAAAFAGVEILRRLFGVAQLPLTQTDAEKVALAHHAYDMVGA